MDGSKVGAGGIVGTRRVGRGVALEGGLAVGLGTGVGEGVEVQVGVGITVGIDVGVGSIFKVTPKSP